LDVHNVGDVRQIVAHTAEQLVPSPSVLEFGIAIGKLKKYESPRSDQIPIELIQAGGEILLFAIHKVINSVWNKEALPDQWKQSVVLAIHKKGEKTDCNNYCGISLLSTSYKILSSILLSRLSPYIDNIIGDYQCGFRRNKLPIEFSAFTKYWRNNGSTMRQYISYS
jgi:hypothetical protein